MPAIAAAMPLGTRTRPAMRCQRGRWRRKPAANWKAPTTQNVLALKMCTSTGTGMAKKRWLSGVTGPPLANWVTRSAPARTGTSVSASSPAVTSHSRLRRPAPDPWTAAGLEVTTSWFVIPGNVRAGPGAAHQPAGQTWNRPKVEAGVVPSGAPHSAGPSAAPESLLEPIGLVGPHRDLDAV